MNQLKKGDGVAIVLPASHLGDMEVADRLIKACQLLEKWGLEVILLPDLSKKYFYLAGDDEYRLKQLQSALAHPKVKAIFCARGGYGSSRFVDKILDQTFLKHKVLVGFSDITSLHLALCHQISCVHAPNLLSDQLIGDDAAAKKNQDDLYQCLFEGSSAFFEIERLNASDQFNIQGELTGGNLTLVAASIGTRFSIQTKEKILLLEEVNESPYRLDRMLTQLENADLLKDIKAVVFGEMKGCHSSQIKAKDIILDLFSNKPYPVFVGAPFGHGAFNCPWIYQQEAVIDAGDPIVRMKLSFD